MRSDITERATKRVGIYTGRTAFHVARPAEMLVATDGACLSGGLTGWAFAAADGRSASDGTDWGTSSYAELSAVLLALEDLPDVPLLIQTDSAYVINCCVKFKKMWQANWYTKRDGTSVRNQDVLWPIHHLLDKRTSVRFVKVKGHRRAGGHDRNPLHADAAALARRAARAAAAG